MPTHLVARDTALSGGAIAGVVVGCVVAATVILLCVLPFVIRARRLRHVPDGDPLQAEIGQGDGGLVGGPLGLHTDASHRRLSSSVLPAVNGHHEKENGQQALGNVHPTLPTGISFQQGLPSPISPPLSAAARFDAVGMPSQGGKQGPVSTAGAQSEAPRWSSTRGGSTGSVGKTISRDMSMTDSYGAPSRVSTGFMADGITEEPEHLDRDQPHRHWSLRRLLQGSRRGSRRSSTNSPTVPRSPVLDLGEALVHAESAPPAIEPIDTEVHGAAYEYYHGVIDMQDSYTFASAPASTSASKQTSVSSPVHGQGIASRVGPTAFVEEPEAISPDSDQTISPTLAGRFFPHKVGSLKPFLGTPQRMDTLPPQDIVADIPSPPVQAGSEPSGNPMDIMKPSNDTEKSWALDQEILRIENSPPPPVGLPSPPPAEQEAFTQTVVQPDSELAHQYHQLPGLAPAQKLPPAYGNAAPEIELNGEDVDMDEMDDMNEIVDMSDYSTTTPPPSTGPSNENTPDTGFTESSFPGSPSPPPFVSTIGASSHSPMGASHSPMGGQSPGAFVCETCNRVFDQVHKLNHHRRYHERPHECSYPNCNMRFGTKTHLDRHINDKHKKSRKIYCMVPDCPYSRLGGKSFPRKDNWKRHMLNKHSITHEGEPGPEFMDDILVNS